MASKRKTLCIDEKVLLIRAIESGEKKSTVARRYGFSPSTVSTIWKNKEKFLLAEMDGKSCKKLKKPKFEVLDEAMLSWYRTQLQNDSPVSGPIIRGTAETYAKQLNIPNFKASEGWLGKFKQRHRVKYSKGNTNGAAIQQQQQEITTNFDCSWINLKVEPLDVEYEEEDVNPAASIEEALHAAKILEKFFLIEDDLTISQYMKQIQEKIQLKYWNS